MSGNVDNERTSGIAGGEFNIDEAQQINSTDFLAAIKLLQCNKSRINEAFNELEGQLH